MALNLPPGWPDEAQPPGSDGWEASAVNWLLDLVPAYRPYNVLHRHPVILAFIDRHLIHGSVVGARDGYQTIRTELAAPHATDAALKACRDQGRRLAASERAVDLVERALRGGPYSLDVGPRQCPASRPVGRVQLPS
jgi:hypothetical protein